MFAVMLALGPSEEAEEDQNVRLDLQRDVEVVDNVVDTQGHAGNCPGEEEHGREGFSVVAAPVLPYLR